MPCENYQDALNSAAAGAPATRALRSHLASCAACRAALAEEQALVASINAGLCTVDNAREVEVPPSLISSVRARLAAEPAPQGSSFSWTLAGACAAAVLLIAVISAELVRQPARQRQPSISAGTQPPIPPVPSREGAAGSPDAPPLRTAPRFPSTTPTAAAASVAPAVLVPPDEREAFAHFLTAVETQSTLATALAKPDPAPGDAPSPVHSIAIAALEVKPLEGEEAALAPRSENRN
jgi:hypothetical protein